MGYRNYLYSIPKKEHNKIKNKKEEELVKLCGDDGWFSPCRHIRGVKEIYEFGKYCELQTKGRTKRFFLKFKDEDGEFMIAEKNFLLHCIDHYRQKVADYYKNLQNKPVEEIKKQLKTKSEYWGGGEWVPYNLNEKTEHLVESWEYEHQIFDLVRILKTFDFEKNILIYAGH